MEATRKPIDDGFINRIKDVADIVTIIGSSVNLKTSGAGRYVGLCPFHDEKTPSFSVNAEQNFYHCFGCGVSGDSIKFIMEQEGMDFYDAIHRLAQLQGMQVEYRAGMSAQNPLKEEDFQLVQLAADFYHQQLFKHDVALKYFNERGVDEALIKEYHLGYAPPGYDNLLKQLGGTDGSDGADSKRGIALRLGLIKKNEQGKIYDVFRDRIIFPILDMRKRPLGFGGRIINNDSKEAKYINSADSPIFHKQFNVFGLPQALQSKASKHLVVVEGYMDVLPLAGVDRAVASLGTAFSTPNAKILWGRSEKLILAFDGDAAGRKASERSIGQCLPALADNKELSIKFMPTGKDPYDVIHDAEDGEAAWHQIEEISLENYLLQPFVGSMDPQAQRLAIANFANLVAQLPPDSMRSKLLVKKVEDILGGIKIPIATQNIKHTKNAASQSDAQNTANPNKSHSNLVSHKHQGASKSNQHRAFAPTAPTNNVSQMQISPEQKLVLQLMFAPTISLQLLKKWQSKLEEAAAFTNGAAATQTLEIIKAAQLGSAALYGYAGGAGLSFVAGGDSLLGVQKGSPDACIAKILVEVYKREMAHANLSANKQLSVKSAELIKQLKAL